MTTAPAQPSHWEAFREEQRNIIAATMLEAVSDRDLKELNVSTLAARAGMSRKTFYKYFDSLGAATSYAYGSILRSITRSALDTLEPHWSGLEKFMHVLSQLTQVASTQPQWIRFMSYFDHSINALRDTEQLEVQELTAVLFQDFAHQFRQGQADGSIRADLATQETVLAISTAVVGVLQRCVLMQPRLFTAQTSAQIIALELHVWRSFVQAKDPARPLR